MKLWLASSNLDSIERLTGSALFAGVVTNPNVVAEAGLPVATFLRQVITRGSGLIFYQVRGSGSAEMIAEAERTLALAPERIAIKVPATIEGLRAIAILRKRNAVVAATCLPTPALAVLAEAAGANYIIPWGSMLATRGIGDRESLLAEMCEILTRQKSQCEMIVGAYSSADLLRLARLGVTNAFIWEKDVDKILRQPMAQEAIDSFEKAWKSIDACGG